jgi:hypothetical protein
VYFGGKTDVLTELLYFLEVLATLKLEDQESICSSNTNFPLVHYGQADIGFIQLVVSGDLSSGIKRPERRNK